MWTDAPKWPEFSLWKDKKKSTKALRFIQSHGDRGHVSKQGCALALSESIWAAKHHKDKLFMGSLAEVLEFNAHQLTITVPNTEWWLGTLNAEQVKSTIYIYLYKKKKKKSRLQEHLRQSGFLFLCCQQFACLHTFNWWRWFSVLREWEMSSSCILLIWNNHPIQSWNCISQTTVYIATENTSNITTDIYAHGNILVFLVEHLSLQKK